MNKYYLNIIIIGIVLNLLFGCSKTKPSDNSMDVNQKASTIVASTLTAIYLETNTQIARETNTQTPTNIPTPSPTSDWKYFQNNAYGISFSYPPNWYGPGVHEDIQGIHIEIGSDVVYPFGTGISDRIYSINDTYFITIEYYKNVEILTLEEYPIHQPWSQPLIQEYSSLLTIANNEELSDIRDLLIRKRQLAVGQFVGIEFIFTLLDTAITERYYSRQIIAFDDELNLLHITGMPNNVYLNNLEKWKDAYQTVDNKNEGIFTEVISTIRIM